MRDFFSDQVGQNLPWFGLTHILLLVGFFLTLVILWILGPRIRNSKYERIIRYTLIVLVLLFEYRVFENRILNGSVFRIPLCGIALYGLTFSVAFKKEKVFKLFYFYAFGAILTYFFYDTIWGLDRWDGWTYFGAHASICWFAIYGYRVFGFTPNKQNLYKSILYLAIYTFISGYAFYKFGGSDELFLFHAPIEEVTSLLENNHILYLIILSSVAIVSMAGMYLPIYLVERRKA